MRKLRNIPILGILTLVFLSFSSLSQAQPPVNYWIVNNTDCDMTASFVVGVQVAANPGVGTGDWDPGAAGATFPCMAMGGQPGITVPAHTTITVQLTVLGQITIGGASSIATAQCAAGTQALMQYCPTHFNKTGTSDCCGDYAVDILTIGGRTMYINPD